MNKLKLEVGGKYLDSDGDAVTVKYIGKESVVYEANAAEYFIALDHAILDWKSIPKERETIELFACMEKLETIKTLGRIEITGQITYKNKCNIKEKIPNMPSIFIDAETFEIVEE